MQLLLFLFMKKLIVIMIFWTSFSTFSKDNLESILDSFCYKPEITVYYQNYELFEQYNEMYSGKSLCKHSNGLIRAEGDFINGKEDGKWTYWYKNGQIRSKRNYKKTYLSTPNHKNQDYIDMSSIKTIANLHPDRESNVEIFKRYNPDYN